MKSNSPNVLCFGELLVDVFPDKTVPGGAPMNVAFHLNQLGIQPHLISAVGYDPTGDVLLDHLQTNGLPTTGIQRNQFDTGTVTVDYANQEATYAIATNVAWDAILYTEEVKQLTLQSDVLVYGSLVARNRNRSSQTLQKLLSVSRAKKIMDLNLRSPHFNFQELNTAIHEAHVLKLNYDELRLVGDWMRLDIADQDKLMERVFRALPASHLIVTNGSVGAFEINEEGLEFEPAVPVTVVDTVGSGDAFLAGWIKMWLSGESVQTRLQFAAKMGSLVAGSHGATPLLHV